MTHAAAETRITAVADLPECAATLGTNEPGEPTEPLHRGLAQSVASRDACLAHHVERRLDAFGSPLTRETLQQLAHASDRQHVVDREVVECVPRHLRVGSVGGV